MSQILESRVFTYQLTDGVLSITESMGVKKVSVYNGTAVIGNVLGDLSLGGIDSTAIDVEENETITAVAIDGSVIKNYTITAPAGCTLKIMAQ